jgi:integrase
MPTATDINRRDRALLAFTMLTGLRDAAVISLKIKHVNLNSSPVMVKQEPNEIKTKFSKQIFSHFLPVGDDFVNIVKNWITELKENYLYGPNDPIFPRTKIIQNEKCYFESGGLEAVCWANATPMRSILRKAFINAELPYYSPHRLRDTLTHYGQQVCQTPEDFKAWSQSLGHQSPLTTFTSYGQIDPFRQGRILEAIGKKCTQNKKEPDFLRNEIIKLLELE